MPLSSVVGASSIIQPGVCTSTTRPASPYDGQVIYETDTNLVKAFDGTAFVTVGPPTPGGILQVVQGTRSTQATTSSTTMVTTGLTATITPAAASNKVLILVQLPFGKNNDSVYSDPQAEVFRGTVAGTALSQTRIQCSIKDGNQFNQMANMMHVDSPNTTSAQIYTVGFLVGSSLDTAIVCRNNRPAKIILMEVSA